jgi:hypothetical protein
VTLRTNLPVTSPPPGVEILGDDRRLLRARVSDVARELPLLLRSVGAQGCEVEDVEVRGPSLQAVFIHLTGRELRE